MSNRELPDHSNPYEASTQSDPEPDPSELQTRPAHSPANWFWVGLVSGALGAICFADYFASNGAPTGQGVAFGVFGTAGVASYAVLRFWRRLRDL